ncbi:unnamed protein product [Caenorhabditis bovis]|uniref:Uncharacterized protein n=1 Tax=Caenorhabditis bovis TaxID=2654633 RepID=A0A8S1EAG8_9PELO|nr:unnamed protein product [Caenorhabditis bovis]
MGDFIELAEDGESASQRIAEALKDAREGTTFDAKIKSLACAMHILVDPTRPNHLLDNFLDEMLEFGELNETRVLCLLVDFLQKACAKDPSLCSKAVERLSFYLTPNENILKYNRVIKRVIVACTNLYPIILEHVIKRGNEVEAERCWQSFNVLKSRIIDLVDCDRDGIRTVTIKFLEALILCQSPKPREPVLDANQQLQQNSLTNEQNTRFSKISLNDVPRGHRFISYRKAQMEAEENFTALIKQTTIAHITSQNLLTVIDALCMITRCRPQWENALERVFDAMKSLHSNVPPMLSSGQVKALRKELKRNLLRFLKLPAAVPMQHKIRSQLTDYLGASPNEVNRAIPPHLVQKVTKIENGAEPAAKKMKITNALTTSSLFQDDEDDDEPSTSGSKNSASTRPKDANTEAIEITAKYIFERLNSQVVTNLVFISLLTLPDEMPASFNSSYTPIAQAGTEEQRMDVSRMMATQATQREIGPGYEMLKKRKEEELKGRQKARKGGVVIAQTPAHVPSAGISRTVTQKGTIDGPTPVPVLRTKKAFNLLEETKKMTDEEMEEMFELAFESVLRAERRVVQGGATMMYQQLVVRLASRYKKDCSKFEEMLVKFIVDDHKKRTDLALLWICELYAQYQGYSYCSLYMEELISGEDDHTKKARFERYDQAMCKLLKELVEKQLYNEPLFYKLLLEAPLVTTNAFEYLRIVCLNTESNALGMSVLRELILTRNRQRPQLLQFFFALCFQPQANLRSSCIETAKELCNLPHIRTSLTERAVQQIQDCLDPVPPDYAQLPGEQCEAWTDEMYKSALVIYTTIMPFDSSLLLPLGSVYAAGTTNFKKVVLRTIEPVMRVIGMHDQQVLRLIEECPPGAETLVARIVHLLTERTPATPELVMRAKKLHDERHMDIRALIPIIGGLSRDEVIRLIPNFVFRAEYQKSVSLVFKRLYMARDLQTGDPCFDPIDLIKEYHLIKPSNEKEKEFHINNLSELFDTKYVKRDVASQAIETIFEIEPTPYLFPQSLCVLHNKFTAFDTFVSTLLQKFIDKKHWKQSEFAKMAFFEAIAKLKTVAYGAVLTSFSFEDYTDLKTALGENLVEELKEFFPTMSTSQQKTVDEKIKEEVYDKEREYREKKMRKERKERERERETHRERTREDEKDHDSEQRRIQTIQKCGLKLLVHVRCDSIHILEYSNSYNQKWKVLRKIPFQHFGFCGAILDAEENLLFVSEVERNNCIIYLKPEMKDRNQITMDSDATPMCLSSCDNKLFVGLENGSVEFYAKESGEYTKTNSVQLLKDPIFCIASCSKSIAVGCAKSPIFLLNLSSLDEDPKQIHYPQNAAGCSSLSYSPNLKQIAAGFWDGSFRVFSSSRLTILLVLSNAHSATITSICWNQRIVAACSLDETVSMWNFK